MKTQIALIIVCITCVILLGVLLDNLSKMPARERVIFDQAYKDGMTKGTENGYKRGFLEGGTIGYNEGYNEGNKVGIQKGLKQCPPEVKCPAPVTQYVPYPVYQYIPRQYEYPRPHRWR